MPVNRKDVATGGSFIGIGTWYGSMALQLPIGQALNMGPGYFPIFLSGLLIVIGAAVMIRAFVATRQTPFGAIPWRALVMLPLAIVTFAALLPELGLLPGIFLASLLACLASREIRTGRALAISLSIAVLCTLVFIRGVGLPIPILGRWFGL